MYSSSLLKKIGPLTLFLAIVYGIVWSLSTESLIKLCLVKLTHPILTGLLLCWIYTFFRFLRFESFSWTIFIKKQSPTLIYSFFLAGLTFSLCPPSFHILADETNLLALSKSFFEYREAINVTAAKWYENTLHPFFASPPIRPLLFPFLVHCFHLVGGYETYHPFILNFLCLTLLLFLVSFRIRKSLGKLWAYLAPLLILSHPLIVRSATSGGFDLFSLLLWFIAFLLVEKYLQNPNTPIFYFLWVHLILICHVRYENPLFVFIIGFYFTLFSTLSKKFFTSPIIYLSPLFLLPILWQRLLQIEIHAKKSMFNFENFVNNTPLALKGFFIPGELLASPWHLHFLGMLALGTLIYHFFLQKSAPPPNEISKKSFIIIGSCTFAHLGLMLIFYFGDVTAAVTTRLFLIHFFVLTYSIPFLLSRIPIKPKTVSTFICLLLFITSYPKAFGQDTLLRNQMPDLRRYQLILKFLENQGPRNFLTITGLANLYTPHNYGVMSFEHANKDIQNILRELELGLYREIFVIQEIDQETQKPLEGERISKKYQLIPLWEVQHTEKTLIRFSKVIKA